MVLLRLEACPILPRRRLREEDPIHRLLLHPVPNPRHLRLLLPIHLHLHHLPIPTMVYQTRLAEAELRILEGAIPVVGTGSQYLKDNTLLFSQQFARK